MVTLNSEDKIIKVNFEKPTDDYKKAESLVRQWDKGQYLQITGLDLPEKVQIHFSLNSHKGEASKVWADTVDGVTTAAIPANILEAKGITGSSYCAYAFIYLTDEESAKTVKKIILEVESRPRPEDYIYTPEDVKTWEDHENRISDIEKNSAETIKQAVNDYLKENPIESGTSDAVQYIAQTLTEEQQAQARTNIGAASAKEVGQLSEEINNLPSGGSGLTTTASALLIAVLKSCYTSSNQDANLDALERELLGSSSGGDTPSEPDTPVDPDEPTTPTLTSISAVANETTVAVGTKAEDLDITVTAHYSDGTTETITDYSISGTVGVGENTFTIVYGGKTTTVTVIGQNIPVYSLYDTTPSAEIGTGCTPFSVDQDVSIFIDITPVTISSDTSIWYVANADIVFYQNYMRSGGKALIIANKVSTAKVFGGEITAIGDNIKAIFTRRAGSTTYEVYWYQKKSSGAEYWTKNTDFEVGTFLPVDSEIRLTPKQTFNKFEVYTNKYTTEAEALEFTGGTAFTEV